MRRTATGLSVAAALCFASAPAIGAAKTPTPEASNAGRVHELSVMLESVMLRCNLIGINLRPSFQTFAARQQRGLFQAEEILKRHFGVVVKADMNGEIDRYYIRTYNFYGIGRTEQQACTSFGQVMEMLAEADPDGAMLSKIAEIMVPEPMLDTHN